MGFPGGTRGKESICWCRKHKRCEFAPWVGKIPCKGAWQPAPVFLPGESHGQRSLVAVVHRSQRQPCCCSVAQLCPAVWDPVDFSTLGFAVLPSPGACSNSRPLNQWCHPTISSSVVSFSSCLPSLPASGSLAMSQLFAWGGQSIGASVSASVLLLNVQDWFSLGLTGLISLQSKWLSRVFSNTIVQNRQFFGVHPSLWSKSHIYTWLMEKP